MKNSLWTLLILFAFGSLASAQEYSAQSRPPLGATLGSPIEMPAPNSGSLQGGSRTVSPRIVRATSGDDDTGWAKERTVADVIGAPLPEVEQGLASRGVSAVNRFGFRADYLLWWVKPAPNPVPLVTTGPFDPNTFVPGTVPGAFGAPSTSVLAGNNSVGLGAFSGFRLQGEIGLDSEGIMAIEAGGFLLARRSANFSMSSNAAGIPFLANPFADPAGNEHVVAVAVANDAGNVFGGAAGTVSVTNSLQLWGVEANLSTNLWYNGRSRADLLVGFRYVDLQESLDIVSATTPIGQPFRASFAGADVQLGQTLQVGDFFRTRNQFYGGQVGARFDTAVGERFNLEMLAKVALGGTHQTSSINGATTLLSPGAAAQVVPGGVYAQLSNIGTQTGNSFSVIPEIGLNLAYRVSPRVRVLIGYSFIYWDNVVRPGNQMDRVVDPRAIPSIPAFSPGVATRPAPMFDRTDFWAHGVNFGLDFRY